MKYFSPYFGQAYGEGDYGEGRYTCTTQQEAEGICSVASTGSGGGNLSDTGVGILAIATVACLIVFAALVIRIWRRKPASQPVKHPVDAPPRHQ